MLAASRRAVPGRLAAAVLALLVAPGRLAAEVFELPAEIALDAEALVFELAAAELRIEVRAGSEPRLRARTAGEGRAARLEAVAEEGSLTLRRPAEDAAADPRLRLEAVVAPGQRVRLAGSGLDLAIEERPLRDPEARDPEARDPDAASPTTSEIPAPPAAARFELWLDGSTADLAGLESPVLDLTATSVWLTATRGSLGLTLSGGTARVRGHRGSLALQATDAEVAVADFQGLLVTRLQGGSLEVRDGDGNCNAFARDAGLRLEGWAGTLSFRGANATVEARGSGGAKVPWRIEGGALELALDDVGASVAATLEGGRLQGRGLARVQATATGGARLELAELAGPVALTLSDGAEARVRAVAGELRVELRDAALEADGAARLALAAARSRVTARGIARLAALEADDAELELDLSELTHSPSLRLGGASRAAVRLAPPCLVRPQGPAALDDRIRITGCDLLVPGQRIRGQEAFFRYGDRRVTTLTPLLSEGSSLEIEGRP